MARTVEITDQGSFIPASQRPDGSWRKARRIKEGYVPQEEVPLYESKGKQWANNKNLQYPAGLDPAIIKEREEAKLAAAQASIHGLVNVSKAKKKKKKKKKSGENEVNGEDIEEKSTDVSTVTSNNSETADEWHTVQSKSGKVAKLESTTQNIVPPVIDPAKRLKNLKKKMREIEAIEAKITSGEVKKPDKDQIEKVNRKSDLLSEIFALELTVGQG